jgi:glutamate synthase domain-containing protein 2
MENDPYLSDYRRSSDDLEKWMEDIHEIAFTGRSITEPMRTHQEVVSWDEILIRGAQLARIPLNREELVNTETVIGPASRFPLIIQTPILVTHMSFGALSREMKIALAKEKRHGGDGDRVR